MAPETHDLLRNAMAIDHRISAADNPDTSNVKVVEPPLPSDLHLVEEDGDPFNGNLNNRRVAERIASTPGKRKQFLNNSMPTHIGDPKKAAEDVAKSKAINPDPTVTADRYPPIFLEAQADPAKAKGAAKPKDTSAPAPTWSPNAGV